MEIKVLKTYEIPNELWGQIADGFNESFNLNVSPRSMKNGFCIRNREGYGYHAIALSDEGELMGYNVFSPVLYKNGLKTVVSGSTFVRKKYRTNELLFMEMMNALRKAVVQDGYSVEVGVPNHNSETFALKILKYKPVAELDYYVLPFSISRIINRQSLSFLDPVIKLFASLHILLQRGISMFFKAKENRVKYELELDAKYWENRFGNGSYKNWHQDEFHAYWLPYDENGSKVAYLMDFRQGNVRTYRSLVKALCAIKKSDDYDMILYVGFLHLKQLALLRCPQRYIPKRLPLTFRIIKKTDEQKYSDMNNKINWNFSLMNFDAR